MSKIEKIRTIEAIASGKIDPVREKRKVWLFEDNKVFRVLSAGDLVKADLDHFERFNGSNDISFYGLGETIPENTQGQIIESGNPDSLHALALQYLKLMGKNFKPKNK